MTKDYPGETWKNVEFNFEYTNEFRLEVSNFGRIRSFNKLSDGNILKGSIVNGYPIIRLKFFRKRNEAMQGQLDYFQEQVDKVKQKLKTEMKAKSDPKQLEETRALLESVKAKLSRKFKDDARARTINYHCLFHKLVADYFLQKPEAGKTIVAHLDHNKTNNRVNNLAWMTPEENYKHQALSPAVIKEKEDRKDRRKEDSKATKLTVTKVMLLKKMLNQDRPIKQLVKQFKITDTQIYRIKRGENWSDVEAAE